MADTKEVAQELMRGINTMSLNPTPFVEVVTQDHRTLQQAVFRLFAACVREWATHERFDDRNEATVRLSKRIVEALGDDLERIPFI
jgi:hypothetical protein